MAGYPIVRSVDFDKPKGTPQARKKTARRAKRAQPRGFPGNKTSDRCFRQHLVERDGQITHPHAGRVIHGIPDRSGYPRNANFTDAPRTERVEMATSVAQNRDVA